MPRPPTVAACTLASISAVASRSWPRPAASIVVAIATGGLVEQLGRRGHLAGQKIGYSQVVERELQVHEGTGVAGGLSLAGGEGMPGLEVPQLYGDEAAAAPGADQPEPAAGLAGAGVQGEQQLERPGERGYGGCISLGVTQRERVEQDVGRARRVWSGRRGERGLGRLPHAAGAAQVAGPLRGHERFQVRLTGQAGI